MVFFDYGNTLIYEEVFQGPETLEKVHRTIEEGDLGLEDFYHEFLKRVISYQEKYFSMDRDFLYDQIFEEVFNDFGLRSALAFEELTKIYFDSHAVGYPMEGAKELLDYLEEKSIPFGVISNLSISGENLRRRIIEVLDKDIDLVLTSGDAYYRKPDSEIFKIAARMAGVDIKNCLYVGDNPLCDYKGATDAGMMAVYFQSPRTSPFVRETDKISLEDGAFRVNKLTELIKIIEGDKDE